jgi:zinc/manganese transport system substrate-binding protein
VKKLLFLLLPFTLFAHLNIAVSYPYIGAITKTIGGDHISTIVLAQGSFDPHFITPKPSLIAKLRGADGLIINGGGLEIGWIPPLLKRASNTKLASNSKSFLDLSKAIELMGAVDVVDRADGDVHPEGNPHFHLSPANILLLAKNIKEFLISIDGEHRDIYEKNYSDFNASWNIKMGEWAKNMADKKGIKVLQYHDVFAYFNDYYGIKSIGTIEPLPGIAPSSKHTLELLKLIDEQKPCCILHDVYHPTKTAEFISAKSGIGVVVLPHDIEAMSSITNLEVLFDFLTTHIR